MIPYAIPSLTGISVLVTRPAAQADALCAQIAARGGEAIRFPAVAIEPIESLGSTATGGYDLVVFVSVNAVRYGIHRVDRQASTRIAAIGKATAAALMAAEAPADIVPDTGFDSEALLAHPQLGLGAGARVLIVRGIGGRETLATTLGARGMHVDTLEVYRRTLPPIDAAERDALQTRWANEGIDIVTATSVQTLSHLLEMLSDTGRMLLRAAPLLVASARIGTAAAEMGIHADCIVAPGADDRAMIGALEQWVGRAR